METGQTCTFMVFLQKIGSNPHGNLSNYHSSRSQKYPWKPPNVGQKFNAWRLLAIFRRKTPRPAWTFPAGRGINNQKAHFRSAGLLKSSHLLKAENPQPLPTLRESAVDFFIQYCAASALLSCNCSLSAIRAINSLFVGLPLVLLTV